MRKIVLASAAAGAALAPAACGKSDQKAAPDPAETPAAKPVSPAEQEAYLKKIAAATTVQEANLLALYAPSDDLKQKAKERSNELLKASQPPPGEKK